MRLKNPRRGDKARLAETVRLNAVQALQRHKLARAGDITVRSQGLEELRLALDLERAPLRIECYDVSHTQGTHQVASMVVFEDGLAKKPDYRHFNVRGPEGEGAPDDTAAMDEVLRRRLTRLVAGAAGDDAGGAEDADAQADPPAAGAEGVAAAEDLADAAGREAAGEPAKARRFAYRPDLILVDGGLAQVNAAQRVVEETGADVRIAGLAKRLEEVWVPGEEFPVILPRTSPALRLLQQLRDESHRFAIAFHRRKRSKAMTRSSLDAVAGLGPAKQKALLAAFGSVAKIKRATVEDLESVRGIGPSLARAIVEHFRPGASDPGARPVA